MTYPRPCSYCGHGQFLMVPNMAVMLHKPGTVVGYATYEPRAGYVEVKVFICTSCSRVEWFTTNGPKLKDLPGAEFVNSEPP